ncbi:MAG: universal stress protein [Kofleriaceae bacterium]
MKRILTAVDSSPRAQLVLQAAARLAELTKAKLVLFRAIGVPPDMPHELLTMTDTRLEDYLTANARSELARLVTDIRPELIERTEVKFATPWDGICRTARECEADLIVLGSHGYGGIDRILGTNAAKVVNHADRNVLVVRTKL